MNACEKFSSNVTLYALHGFLGTPHDWLALSNKFNALKAQKIKLEAIDLFLYAFDSLECWAEQFNSHIRKSETKSRCLLGYSLGGRLALHALLNDPSLWDAAIIISAHYGLDSEEEKKERRFIDERWALNFQEREWTQLMQEWNNQELFKSNKTFFPRVEANYSRDTLSASLRQLSLGTQESLLASISSLQKPILWITGADDLKYTDLAKKMRLAHSLSEICTIPFTGHRVPWEQPERFLLKCEAFLNEFIDKF
jgi:2-succinyl-6-hydroxy-2,4-cyclohexadiene-1-carboxylate synthase